MSLEIARETRSERYQDYLPRLILHWEADASQPSHRQIDGTMLFCDISGFTAMSERLARFGKMGAEEVTEVLGECFRGLMEVAYPLGGRLIKFGGDALLLLFDEDHHQARAVNAAVGMQNAIETLGKVATSAGRMSLQMSIGAHCGAFHFFMVGDSHRELILTGPAATRVVAMEGAAEATEIVMSPEMAAALPAGVAGDEKGPGVLVRETVPGVDESIVDVREGSDNLEQYIPVGIRQAILAGDTEPEHRQVTVAFLHFLGVDQLLDAEGPGAVGDALQELVSDVQQAVDPRRVAFLASDIYDDGGKIILAAGAPTATGNDSERMLLALREIIEGSRRLPIRVGVNRGHVFAGDVGPSYRRTYTIMGDEVNLAARLMAAAGPGEIFATPRVLRRSRTLFATEPLEPFHVKGKAEPVKACLVGEEAGIRTESTREELPFKGRSEELARITSSLEQARRGTGGVLSITGDRGIGKTRLVEEALARVPEIPSLTVRAEPYGVATAYRPFRDPLRELLGIEGGEQQAMARQLSSAVGRIDRDLLPFLPLLGDVTHVEVPDTPEVSDIEPEFRHDRLADAVVRLLEGASPGPLALVLEETHWMDEASAELSERLTAATAARPWLVATTRRDQEGGFDATGAEVLELAPLSPDDAEAIVIEVTDERPLRPHDITAIVQRAGGNPLFLGEILSVVGRTGDVGDLPDSVEALVAAQIDGLEAGARRLLRLASVLGRSFSVELLDEILAEEPVALDAGTQDGLGEFLEPDGEGRMQFRHALLRDVAYEGLPFRRRRQLHRRAAETIERLNGSDPESVADLLALHFSLAQEHEPAWRYGRIAGDQARDAYANVDAATQYERALAAAARLRGVDPKERIAVWIALGDVREQAGMYETSVDAYRHASRLAGPDAILRADLLLKRARARERASAYSIALRNISSGLRLLESLDSRPARAARARLMALRAAVRQAQDRPREALLLADRTIEEARNAGDDEALARAYSVLDWAYHALGRPDEAVYAEESLRMYGKLGMLNAQAMVTINLGAQAYFAGRWDDALDFYRRAREMAQRAGNTVTAASAASNMGEVFVNQGRTTEAEPVLRESVRVLRASGYRDATAFAEIHLARLLASQDRLDEAEVLLRTVFEELESLGRSGSALEAATYRAECRIQRGQPEDALAILDSAERSAGQDRLWYAASLARVRAAALATIGDYVGAAANIDDGLSAARNHDLQYEQALLLLTRAELAGRAGREPDPADLEQAYSLLRSLGVRHVPAVLGQIAHGLSQKGSTSVP